MRKPNHPELDLLHLYRSIVPKGVRSAIRPTVGSLYRSVFKKEITGNELKAAERRVIQAAQAKYKQWNLTEALADLDLVLRENPTQRSALHLKADILARAGRQDDARKITRTLLSSDPLDLRAISRLRAMGTRYRFTPEVAENAVAQNPMDAISYVKAATYLNEGSLPAAASKIAKTGLTRLSDALRLSVADKATLVYEYGHSLLLQGKFEQADQVLQTVPKLTAAYAKAIGLRARCYVELNKGAEAERVLKLIDVGPGYATQFHNSLFPALLQQDRIGDAHKLYRLRASSEAIAEYFAMPQRPSEIGITSGLYRDRDALFVVEGGPGDEIRLASMYGALIAHCGSVTISCEPRLQSLFTRSFPEIAFIPTRRYRKDILSTDIESRSKLTDMRLYPCVSDDVIEAGRGKALVCSTLDALADLRTRRQDFQANPSRLVPDGALSAHWREQVRTNDRLQIGLSWRSMLLSKDRNRHYLKAEDLAPLASLPNVDFWLLQTNVEDSELAVLQEHMSIRVSGIDMKDDFEGQAALICNLDAVVSPLSTMAELSGMLGTPTLIFCRSHEASWRRNSDGSDVWYPHGRLVTGDPIQDVPSLVSSLVSELSAIEGSKTRLSTVKRTGT